MHGWYSFRFWVINCFLNDFVAMAALDYILSILFLVLIRGEYDFEND